MAKRSKDAIEPLSAAKIDLIRKGVFEVIGGRDMDNWYVVLSREEIRAYKMATDMHFFNEDGERLKLDDQAREAVVQTIVKILSTEESLQEYIDNFPYPDHPENDAQYFDGRDCCSWARVRRECCNPYPCGCVRRWGGWWCDTPGRHGTPEHGSCNNSPKCECRCGDDSGGHRS